VAFARLPESVIAQVVDKFVLQLEAQLADRNVTIELSDEAREWLIKNGYDETMGARPMARVIQSQIKTPLADEVLFGRLKNGGVVRVLVTADDSGLKKLGFVYPEGPAQPRPERDVIVAGRKRAEGEADARKSKARKRDGGASGPDADDAAPDAPGEVSPSEPQAT
jgi:ATP-dependent Clp protease ATP-binding subunit ClpA